jgi:hypothetical protein
MAFCAKISTAYFCDRYAAKSIVSSGEIVKGLFEAHGRYQPTGEMQARRFIIEKAFCRRIRDGKILERRFLRPGGTARSPARISVARAEPSSTTGTCKQTLHVCRRTRNEL